MVIACPYCAATQEMPPPPPRGKLACWRCEGVLERTTGRSVDGALACSIATLLLLVPANLLTLMTVRIPGGLTGTIHLASGCVTAWMLGWPLMGVLCALQGVLLPFLRFGLLAVVLGALRCGAKGGWIGPAFHYAERLDIWAMPDVFLIGAAIGWGRVISFIPVRIDSGGWCFIAAAMMTMVTRACLDRRAVWRRIGAPASVVTPGAVGCVVCDLVLPAGMVGHRCPRCAARLHRRKPFALMRVGALVMAGYLLFPVANYFPMSALYELGVPHPHTIFAGIQLLFDNGYMPLAVLIFFTSIGIPIIKLVGLTWFLISVQSRSRRALRFKTKLYRFIDEVGRWSNLDPFTVIIFTPMVQFGSLAHIRIEGGSPAFLALVVISMVAARLFDPRLMWDAAGKEAGARPRTPGRRAAGRDAVAAPAMPCGVLARPREAGVARVGPAG